MRDGQMNRFLTSRGFMNCGLISYHEPDPPVRLFEILEPTSPKKYFLSPKACAGILRRAARRGKALPTILHHALQAVAGESSVPERAEGKTL